MSETEHAGRLDSALCEGLGPVTGAQTLVERLRTRNGRADGLGLGLVCDEAAAEIERLRAALAQSCDEHRSQIYEAGPGGGCPLLADAVAAERERCLRLLFQGGAPRSDEYGDWAPVSEAIEKGLRA